MKKRLDYVPLRLKKHVRDDIESTYLLTNRCKLSKHCSNIHVFCYILHCICYNPISENQNG